MFNTLEMDYQDTCTVIIVLIAAFIFVYYISDGRYKPVKSGIYYETSPAIVTPDDVAADVDSGAEIDVVEGGGSIYHRRVDN